MPSHEEWAQIRATRQMQNEPDRPCICRHDQRAHRVDPMRMADGARCEHVEVQFSPVTRTNVRVVCTCTEFRLARG